MEAEESYPDSDGEMADEVDDAHQFKESSKQNGSSSVGEDTAMSGGSASDEAEDGEILEDGEIDEEVVEPNLSPNKPELEDVPEQNKDAVPTVEIQDSEKTDTQKDESESEKEDDGLSKERRKKEKKRKKRQKEKKRKGKEDSKRKRKRHDYVDFDNIEDEMNHQPKTRRRSPPGPYDSPYQSQEERGNRSPPGPYDSPYRSPPGPYDSPPDSPPGPYDSPPEDSDEDDRYGDQKNHRKRAKKSMMGLLEDPYLDPTIAASEKQDIFQGAGRGRHPNRRRPKMEMPPLQRKKPLLATPRSDRPLCKFYKEGKCAKGSQCPFNHDFTPQKKPDICKFYLNSTCNKGNDCIYMHGEYPCKFFHTGAECYGGDNCKFSHDPLTAETYPLLNKILDNDDEFVESVPKVPRPSLLGSPPRHVKEAAERLKGEQVKKIPSLLDIEVFPPNQSPQKQQSSPSNEITSPKAGTMVNRPGFYNESTTTNSTVVALEVLLNKAAANQGPRFYQPNNGGYPGGEGQHLNNEDEESEVDNSQDTQKLEEDGSQDDLGQKGEDATTDEDRKQSNIEVPTHLPPKQRELFLRIQHQQQLEGEDGENSAEVKQEAVEPDDDDWYSSDEEETGAPKPKLVDFLKNISKQNSAPKTILSEVPQEQPKLSDSGSAAGSFNILQMLSAITGQNSTTPTTTPAPVSTSELLDSLVPKKEKTIKEIPLVNDSQTILVEKSPVRIDEEPDAMKNLPRVPKDGSDLPYTVLTITVNKSPYIPPNLNLSDPCVSNDPRIQRFLSKGIKLERQNSNSSKQDLKTVPTSVVVPKTSDPRRSNSGSVDKSAPVKSSDPRKLRQPANSDGPLDPRRQKDSQSSNQGEDLLKSGDQRLQRAMTELIQSAVGNPDLRLQKSQSNPVLGMHNMPVPPLRPGFPMGFSRPPPGPPLRPMGPGLQRPPGMPRLSRSVRPPLLMTPIMPDNSFRPRGPRPYVDPRFGRQNSNEMSYGPAGNDPRNRGQGMSPRHEHPSGFAPAPNDPRNRVGGAQPNQDPLLDPRMRQNKSQEIPNYSPVSNDPRFKQTPLDNVKKADPRLDRHSGSLDSNIAGRSSDPRMARQISQPVLSATDQGEGFDSAEDNRLQIHLDPRASRRQESDDNLNSGSPRIKKKKFIGERKGSMEYSSPLGLGSDQPDPASSGFSNYNRPQANRLQINSKLKSDPSQDMMSVDNRLNTGYSRPPLHAGYESPQQQSENENIDSVLQFPAALQAPPLKELFKTIDPTASPFC